MTVADEFGPVRMFAGVLTVTIGRLGKAGPVGALAGFWARASVATV
jgi:hypothetical protein